MVSMSNERVVGKDFSSELLSHQLEVGPQTLVSCRFVSADMNGIRYERYKFIDCQFTDSDISNAEFVDCDFYDCSFKGASLSNSSFSGCQFLSDVKKKCSLFSRTSLTSALFFSSNSRPCLFDSIDFEDVSFRGVEFQSCHFKSTDLNNIPFENSMFVNCEIDYMNLSFGTVKGLKIVNCKITKFEALFEKIFSIVGLYKVLMSSEFQINLPTPNGHVCITELTELAEIICSGINEFPKKGALFEYLNGISLVTSINQFLNISSKHSKQLIISEEFFFNNIEEDLTGALMTFVEKNSQSSRAVNLNNINFSLDIWMYEKCYSKLLLERYTQLINIAKNYRYSFQSLSEVYMKLKNLNNLKSKEYKVLAFTDTSYTRLNYSGSSDLTYTLNKLMELAEITDFQIISRSEGSIIEKLLISKSSLIKTYPKLVGILFILGLSVEIDYTFAEGSITFSVNMAYNLKTMIQEPDKVSEKIEEFRKIDSECSFISLEDLKTLSSLVGLSPLPDSNLGKGCIVVEIQNASIAQVANGTIDKVFLNDQSNLLALSDPQ